MTARKLTGSVFLAIASVLLFIAGSWGEPDQSSLTLSLIFGVVSAVTYLDDRLTKATGEIKATLREEINASIHGRDPDSWDAKISRLSDLELGEGKGEGD